MAIEITVGDLVALYGAAVATVVAVVQLRAHRQERARLRVIVTSGSPVLSANGERRPGRMLEVRS